MMTVETEIVESIEKSLRAAFPHGHEDFVKKCLEEVKLHSEKNHEYALGGDPLGNFKKSADILKMYPGFPYDSPAGYAIFLLLKQLDCVLWSMCNRNELKVEGLDKRLADISVYVKLVSIMVAETEQQLKS